MFTEITRTVLSLNTFETMTSGIRLLKLETAVRCPSDRLLVTSLYYIETAEQVELVLGRGAGLLSAQSTLCYKEFAYVQRLEYFRLASCPPNSELIT